MYNLFLYDRGVAQVVSARRLGRRGRRFKSSRPDHLCKNDVYHEDTKDTNENKRDAIYRMQDTEYKLDVTFMYHAS